jgi:endonuclease YncB( thermonuclease family)
MIRNPQLHQNSLDRTMEVRSFRSHFFKPHRHALPRAQALPHSLVFNLPTITRPDLPFTTSLTLAATAAVAVLLFSAPPALAKGELFGPVDRVVDGDTLIVDGTRVRLFGIDAPESKQSCNKDGGPYACGAASKQALERRIGGSNVRCTVKSNDMYGRSVAICYAPSLKGAGSGNNGSTADASEDLNAWMVANGWAVSYRRYSKAYVGLEEEAQAAQRGIWAGSFEVPDAWRREHPRAGAKGRGGNSPSSSSTSDMAIATDADVGADVGGAVAAASAPHATLSPCLIKGNISAKGAKIYHVPGGRFYESTRIDQGAGERFFCSEKEAVAAGWRPAKVKTL